MFGDIIVSSDIIIHHFPLEQQPMASETLREAIEKAGKFPERLKVKELEEGEWRQLIPFIEQNHNLRELDMRSKFIRKKVITLNRV